MKNNFYVRRLDAAGRLLIPQPLREMLRLGDGASVCIAFTGETLTICRYSSQCIFCNAYAQAEFRGQHVCGRCLHALRAEQ